MRHERRLGVAANRVKQALLVGSTMPVCECRTSTLAVLPGAGGGTQFHARRGTRQHRPTGTLSAQMNQLEEELGAALFVHTTRKVELTPAGRALLEHAPSAL